MLSVKINNPHAETYLANLAKEQGTTRQAIVRNMIMKQIEDAEDYQAAITARADTQPETPLSEVMKQHGMEY